LGEPKLTTNKLFWGLVITILISGGLLNGGRFDSNSFIETSLELLLLASVLTLLYMIWRRTTLNATTRTEKIIQLLRISLTLILFFSLGLVTSDDLRKHDGLILGLVISSVVSAFGLFVLTLLYNALTSKDSSNNSDKDS
jgi:uncharacterized protein YacL